MIIGGLGLMASMLITAMLYRGFKTYGWFHAAWYCRFSGMFICSCFGGIEIIGLTAGESQDPNYQKQLMLFQSVFYCSMYFCTDVDFPMEPDW